MICGKRYFIKPALLKFLKIFKSLLSKRLYLITFFMKNTFEMRNSIKKFQIILLKHIANSFFT